MKGGFVKSPLQIPFSDIFFEPFFSLETLYLYYIPFKDIKELKKNGSV